MKLQEITVFVFQNYQWEIIGDQLTVETRFELKDCFCFRVDRGSVIQKKTKQIQQLLMDEQFYKGERRRAQKVSKGIHGFGSHSMRQRSGSFTTSNNQGIEREPVKQPPRACHVENDSTLVKPRGLINQPVFQKSYTHPGTPGRRVSENLANANDQSSSVLSESGASSPTSQCTSDSNWSAFTVSEI